MRRVTADVGEGVAPCGAIVFPIGANDRTLSDALRSEFALVDA